MHSHVFPTLTPSITQGKKSKISVTPNCSRGHSHLEDGVETGEGWLLSETPFPGELWSLSPLLLHDMFASPSNSCPDIILSISSSDICQIQDTMVGNRKAEPLFANTTNRAEPPAPLQVPHPSPAFNNTQGKFYLQVIVVTSSSTVQVRAAQQTGTDTWKMMSGGHGREL